MLKIQRASAGSGKTYALAKNYIQNLIAYITPDGKWQLRTRKQIEDALLHIIAITFTNKATNEMKQRIVSNLASLSKAAYKTEIDEEFLNNTPYIREFHSLLNKASYQEIGKASEIALNSILNNYSLFRISTIDSFFQEILRTFAYEANINNLYQLEIDSTYVTDSAIDATMKDLDTNPSKMGNSSFWIKTIIKQEAKNSQLWNPFNKKDVKRSVYSNIRNTLLKLEKEDYKEIKEKIDSYFNTAQSTENLKNLFITFQHAALTERDNLLKKIHENACQLKDLIQQNPNAEEQLYKANQATTHIERALSMGINDIFKNEFNEYLKNNSILKKKFRKDNDPLDIKAMEFYNDLNDWKNPKSESFYKNWLVYGDLIPYLGLLLEVRDSLHKVLESNNLIQLSDTSYILKKIIGDEEAPFIFERLGNKIDHFLIDEFQDTSRMQWEVINPLISESESKGNDNLIIGDPKQSIYRFRNANHKLITEEVPNLFKNHINAGVSLEENTNWRSHTLIVKFNNYLFKVLSSILSDLSATKGETTNFLDLYANAVQYPNNQKGKGYVEIVAIEKPQVIDEAEDIEMDENEPDHKNWYDNIVLSKLGPLISSLIDRGYHQKDIAILVNTNGNGQKIVKYLIDYNSSLPKGTEKINFISEESLLVSSSKAVDIIIGVLEKISQPGLYYKKDKSNEPLEEENLSGNNYFNWNKIKLNYEIFSMQHPEMEPASRILSFLNSENQDSLQDLIESISIPSLSSIVDTIINTFIDKDLKKAESLYLSSLQDLINEYSTSHSNDPASFLEWWNSRGRRMSVSTPEGSNAVQIMTIHKSKGLEFKCVIIPFAKDSFLPNKDNNEWRWVKPVDLPHLDFPPVLPIRTVSNLMDSKHENLYREFVDQIITDKINMLYVAFTRAKNELYVFTQHYDKNTINFSGYLKQIFFEKKQFDEIFSEQEKEFIISLSDLTISEEEKKVTLGAPFTKEEIFKEYLKEDKKETIDIRYLEDYSINKNRPQLRSMASPVTPSGEFGSIPPIN